MIQPARSQHITHNMDMNERHSVNSSPQCRRSHTSTKTLTPHSFSIASIFRSFTKQTLAIVALATLNTLTALAADYRPHRIDLNDSLMAAPNISDYYDSLDQYRPIARNISINTPLDQPLQLANNSTFRQPFIESNAGGDDSSIDDMLGNMSIALAASTVDTMKANASLASISMAAQPNGSATTEPSVGPTLFVDRNNYWALFAIVLVVGTAAGNILVCLAIAWERRLQNVTNYFLMSLAITDLMVAILVMPLGILTLFKGKWVEMISFVVIQFCISVREEVSPERSVFRTDFQRLTFVVRSVLFLIKQRGVFN